MKRGIYIILLTLIQMVSLSQNKGFVISTKSETIDSLKLQLERAKNDSVRIIVMENIGFVYETLDVDSSLKYSEAALSLARQRNYAWAEARQLASLSGVMRQQGKFAEALDLLFHALKIAEKNKIIKEVARCNRRLGLVYFDLENFDKALEYYHLALKVDESIPHNEVITTIDHMILGNAYEKINKLDSALLHSETALKQKHLIEGMVQQVYWTLGNIQFKKEDYELANTFYQEGLNTCLKNNDFRTASEISANIAGMFRRLNKTDSAKRYASLGLEYGEKVFFKKGVMLSATLLAELYDSIQPLTAFKYYKIATAAKDSLFGVDNIQTIQNLVSREEARQRELEAAEISFRNRLKLYGLLAGLGVFLNIAVILYRNNRQKQKANNLLQLQKEEIQNTLTQLKITQSQLIQSEKMASLGELTAGIAHEIQNPLNFVNNFSEINTELIDEMKKELAVGNRQLAEEIINDIKQNLEKINHHGKRADSIVKGMLQHSRKSSGQKELTDLNALCDEYLRLAYHGYRAKDKSFNAKFETNFDPTLPKVNVIAQDIGRVLLNLINNAFYAVGEKLKIESQKSGVGYEPTVGVTTKNLEHKIEISVRDNGNGIPDSIKEKIFQPFFTTKPTGQGTGLGLSLSYDIIKAHGGELSVKSGTGVGSSFIITIPI